MSQQSLKQEFLQTSSFCPCLGAVSSHQGLDKLQDDLLVVRRVQKKRNLSAMSAQMFKNTKIDTNKPKQIFPSHLSSIQKVKQHLRSFTPHQQYNQLFLCQRLKQAFARDNCGNQPEIKGFSLTSDYSGNIADM